MKVFELAKELGVNPLELVDELKRRGFTVKNHVSVLTKKEINSFKELIQKPTFPDVSHLIKSRVTKEQWDKLKLSRQKDFSKECQKIVRRLAGYLDQSNSDIAEKAYEEISKLVKSNPNDFSKKVKDIVEEYDN